MSKDKGSKNSKKPAADKSTGKIKKVSAYQSEYSKNKSNPIDIIPPKTGGK